MLIPQIARRLAEGQRVSAPATRGQRRPPGCRPTARPAAAEAQLSFSNAVAVAIRRNARQTELRLGPVTVFCNRPPDGKPLGTAAQPAAAQVQSIID